MAEIANEKDVDLLCIIVNCGLASKVRKLGKQNGTSGGTIFMGKGTMKNKILEFLELYDIRKEVVFMLAEKTVAYDVLEKLDKEFHFSRPNHGIAFSTSVSGIFGITNNKIGINKERGVENPMYNAIWTVVDKGRAEEVIEAATKAGSRGGTIINARGSGIHETSKLFSMDIEPEKEIVLVLSEAKQTEAIVASITTGLKMDEPGNGIVFVQDVNKTIGLYEAPGGKTDGNGK